MTTPQAGDEVAIVEYRRYGEDYVTIRTVDKVTPTGQLSVGGRRYKNDKHEPTGVFREIGDMNRRTAQFPVTDQHRSAITKQGKILKGQKAQEVISKMPVASMTDEEMSALIALADQIKSRKNV